MTTCPPALHCGMTRLPTAKPTTPMSDAEWAGLLERHGVPVRPGRLVRWCDRCRRLLGPAESAVRRRLLRWL